MMIRSKITIWVLEIIALNSIIYLNSSAQEKKIEAPVLSTIVIDPGHGGYDSGTIVNGIHEKDIVLDIALRLGKLIREAYTGINVIFTRTGDVFIPLYERANIANKNKADLFISIHANYFNKSYIRGTETFVLGLHRTEENLEVAKKENSVILLEEDYSTIYEGFDPNSPESYIMFELIQDEYLDQSIMIASSVQEQFRDFAVRENRGVKQAGFIVLKRTTMPGILIETGFLSNPDDRNYLISEEGKNKLAQSILRAFSTYFKKVENKSNVFIANRINPGREEPDKNEKSKSTADSDQNAVIKKPDPEINDRNIKSSTEIKIITGDTDNMKQIAAKPEEKNSEPARENIASSKKIPATIPSKPPDSSDNIKYSIQLAALGMRIDTVPANFKGEQNVTVKRIPPYYKYFSGNFETADQARKELIRIKKKFPDAFIVVLEGEKVYPLKN